MMLPQLQLTLLMMIRMLRCVISSSSKSKLHKKPLSVMKSIDVIKQIIKLCLRMNCDTN
jgi:hypothetical protein